MYAGRLVETGDVAQVLSSPSHPYTQALLGSIPRIGGMKARLASIPGAPPDMTSPIAGCPFAPRCAQVIQECWKSQPELRLHVLGQMTACLRHAELARAADEVNA